MPQAEVTGDNRPLGRSLRLQFPIGKLPAIGVAGFDVVLLAGEKASDVGAVANDNKQGYQTSKDQQWPLTGQGPGGDYPARLSKDPKTR